MSIVPIDGFWPDADNYAPGVIIDCTNLVPTVRGYAGAPTGSSTGITALAAACHGAAVVVKLDSTTRTFAGTTTKVYELSGTSWTDRSRAGNYSLSTSNRWRFAQFGNTTVAANGYSILQSSTTGAFADIAGAPIAKCIDAVNGFVMVGNLSTAENGWKCSAIRDSSDWSESVATQCVSGTLVEAPGAITCVKRLGSSCIFYKEKALYVASYVGAPSVWNIQHIPGEIGTPCQESVVDIGHAHVFVSATDFYIFDGSRPNSIGKGINEWFFRDLNKTYASRIIGKHDPLNTQVYFFYPSVLSSTGAIDSAVVYNYKTQKWGSADLAIEAAIDYSTGAVSYATISDYFATYADINVSFDSPFWASGSPVLAYFDTSHVIKTLTGDSATSDMTLALMGEDGGFSTLTRVRPRFITAPTSATMTNSYTNTTGGALTVDATTSLSGGKFDVLRSARWHKIKQSFVGPVELTANDVTLIRDGTE